MSRIAYVNGRYVPFSQAMVHVEDRGYQFSDGVYEVCLLLNGRLLDAEPHLQRLGRSLAELSIPWPMSAAALQTAMARLVRRNRIDNGALYLQITRGVARRDHAFPNPAPASALVMTVRRFDLDSFAARQTAGVAVVCVPDRRWTRRDIKSVSLLGNVLAKQAAREKGAAEAWMVDREGLVTEGASTTAWIVTEGETLVTRQLSEDILPGITRQVILALAADTGMTVAERAFTVAEAQGAREAFLASTTSFITPVTAIDGKRIGGGVPGPVAAALIRRHWGHVAAQTGLDPALYGGQDPSPAA